MFPVTLHRVCIYTGRRRRKKDRKRKKQRTAQRVQPSRETIFRENKRKQTVKEKTQVEGINVRRSNTEPVRHKFRSPTNARMVNFVRSTDTSQQFPSFLNPFLIERTVGSPGHTKVRNHIISTFTTLGWQVETDEFTDDTPHGSKTFTNIIATLNPSAKKFLTLSCHYDSKVFADFKFIAATDSAVPCAMLVDIATALDNSLKAKNGGMYDGESLQMVFFDGEEAFETWTPTDSIYGARHLAEKWSDNGRLDQMTSLILLDLIGGHPTKFVNFFDETSDLYERLCKIEGKVRDANLYAPNGGVTYFPKVKSASYIEDDHIPFLKRGVPVLHLISHPFPSVWHTQRDNASNLDHAAIANVLRVMKVFLLEYFHLSH